MYLNALLPLFFLTAPAVETQFVQVDPALPEPTAFTRTAGRGRAVILIQGLRLHPFSARNAAALDLHGWQRPGSAMVEALASGADVFAFAYAQTAAVEEIAQVDVLAAGISRLKDLGYRELVFVGHSAGGLIARQFVEDHPRAGVTKVIQVSAPNLGSLWAGLDLAVRANQEPFLRSLTRAGRALSLRERRGKEIPAGVEFLCVIADGAGFGDWVVSDRSQWPLDLRSQGIPAEQVVATHGMIFTRRAARLVAELVERPCARWNREAVAVHESEYLAAPRLEAAWRALRRIPERVRDCVRRVAWADALERAAAVVAPWRNGIAACANLIRRRG